MIGLAVLMCRPYPATSPTPTSSSPCGPAPVVAPDTDTTPQGIDVTVDPLTNDTPGLQADGSAGSWDETSVVSPHVTIDPGTGEVASDPEPQFAGSRSDPVRD